MRYRYSVAREIPRVGQVSASLRYLVVWSRWATWTFLASYALGLPPCRPRTLAAAMPARVRSRMRHRSDSARAPKMWKTSLPPAVVVSICLVRERNQRPGHRIASAER